MSLRAIRASVLMVFFSIASLVSAAPGDYLRRLTPDFGPGNPKGVAFDGVDLWVCRTSFFGFGIKRVRTLDGAILQTLGSTDCYGRIGAGLAWGGGKLYVATSPTYDQIAEVDTTPPDTITRIITTPSAIEGGITYDSRNGSLWYHHWDPVTELGEAVNIDLTGTLLGSVSLPPKYEPHGLGFDGSCLLHHYWRPGFGEFVSGTCPDDDRLTGSIPHGDFDLAYDLVTFFPVPAIWIPDSPSTVSAVEWYPPCDTAPLIVGNTLKGVKILVDGGCPATSAHFQWRLASAAVASRVYRGLVKISWPGTPEWEVPQPDAEELMMPGEVCRPPDLTFFRVSALACSGAEGP